MAFENQPVTKLKNVLEVGIDPLGKKQCIWQLRHPGTGFSNISGAKENRKVLKGSGGKQLDKHRIQIGEIGNE
jgi:hypothetical protein